MVIETRTHDQTAEWMRSLATRPDNTRSLVERWQRLLRLRLLIPLKRSIHSPEQIARGVFVGLMWGLTPTVGIQIALVLVTWFVATKLLDWDFHVLIAIAWTWLTNPLTAVPFYYVFYVTGQALMGNWEDLAGYERFAALWHATFGGDLGFFEAMRQYVYALAKDWALAMSVGCLPYATIGSFMGYWLSLSFVRKYQTAKRRKIAALAVRRQSVIQNTDG